MAMELINNPDYIHHHFSLQIPAFEAFENKLMKIRKDQIESSFNKIKILSKKLENEDGVLYADVRIVQSYFEKLMAIISGNADKELFRQINSVAINDYKAHSEITSSDLLEVILAAGISLN